MTTQVPALGSVVIYALTELDCENIINERIGASMHVDAHRTGNGGGFLRIPAWNAVFAGEQYPMIVTKVNADAVGSVNGIVLLDGSDNYWVPACPLDTGTGDPSPGFYRWPVAPAAPTS